ncbi:SDR family oxidoreductase [Rhizobiaceae bacterium BDR2-2]|uniref:SDR family oxidoreductase n=1 Tax=Ectorhizobium quercum TaxID=2965071 RepID=A0AAE3N0C2_9HYPH|nr:SDR family oxidoreductase [Ectorhizobium quercum]MCX8998269.1 SDR family oxidoreductase [Ectorhizobium quercum]
MSEPVAIYPDLAGKAVFVSGGATGIGAELTEAFARQGSVTCFVDIAEAEGEALAARLNAEGLDVRFAACDITRTADYQATIRRFADEAGPIRVLLNNAANDQRHTLDSVTEEFFDRTIAVNLRHQMFAAQAVVPMMKAAGGGSIVNFGSVSWMIRSADLATYAACKAAVHGMTRCLASDHGADGIRVNTLVPGWVMTEKQLRLWVDDQARETIRRSQCLPGPLLPAHIAQMALFLGSEASAMCTAQNFIVDGGWT